MNAANVLAKLVEIERAVDGAGLPRVRALAIDAQQLLLEVEQQLMETLIENQRLLEFLEDVALAPESLAEFVASQDGDTILSQFSASVRMARNPRKAGPFWIN
jgi:hypothetical protein